MQPDLALLISISLKLVIPYSHLDLQARKGKGLQISTLTNFRACAFQRNLADKRTKSHPDG